MAGTAKIDRAPRLPRRAAALLVFLVACGSGGASSPPTAASGGSGVPEPSGALVPAVVFTCHRTTTYEVDIGFTFNLQDRSVLSGYTGAIGYDAQLLSPTRWSDGSPVELDKGSKHANFHLIVPRGQAVPAELQVRPSLLALDSPAALSAPSVGALVGKTAQTAFGKVTVVSSRATQGGVSIRISLSVSGVWPGLAFQGAGLATLAAGGRTATGTGSFSDGAEQIRIAVARASGPVSLTLSQWRFQADETLVSVPVSSCLSA